MPHSVVKHNIFVFWPLVVIPHWTYIFFCYSSNSWNISRPSLWVPRPCNPLSEFAHRTALLSFSPTYSRILHCHGSVHHHYSCFDGCHIGWLPHGILCLCTVSLYPSERWRFSGQGKANRRLQAFWCTVVFSYLYPLPDRELPCQSSQICMKHTAFHLFHLFLWYPWRTSALGHGPVKFFV